MVSLSLGDGGGGHRALTHLTASYCRPPREGPGSYLGPRPFRDALLSTSTVRLDGAFRPHEVVWCVRGGGGGKYTIFSCLLKTAPVRAGRQPLPKVLCVLALRLFGALRRPESPRPAYPILPSAEPGAKSHPKTTATGSPGRCKSSCKGEVLLS